MIHPNNYFEEAFEQILKEHIDEDLMIFEGIGSVPYFDFTYVNKYVVATLCTKGWIKGEYDMCEILLQEGDLSVLLPDHLVHFTEKSDDYDAVHVLLSKQFAVSLQRAKTLAAKLHFSQKAVVHLNDEDRRVCINVIELMRYAIRHEVGQCVELVRQLFDILYRLLMHLEAFQEKDDATKSRQEDIYERFHDAIVKYHRRSREVIFYADKLCITPKYLSCIVKQVTGKSANDWINRFVIREAKAILRTEKQKTIQKISEELGFPDQATFSKYFKKHTGTTPTDYRIQ